MTGPAHAMAAVRGFAARPPSRLRQGLTLLVGVLLIVAVWDRRGVVVGCVALLFYGVLFGAATLRHEQSRAWSRAHPALDGALIAPLTFLAVAYLSDLSVALCVVIGLLAWAALAVVLLLREH